jgi:hypothetical protein
MSRSIAARRKRPLRRQIRSSARREAFGKVGLTAVRASTAAACYEPARTASAFTRARWPRSSEASFSKLERTVGVARHLNAVVCRSVSRRRSAAELRVNRPRIRAQLALFRVGSRIAPRGEMFLRPVGGALILFVAAGCSSQSSSTNSPMEPGGGTGAAGEAGTAGGGASGGTGGGASQCPGAAPSLGAPCGSSALECSFGDSPFPECRVHVVCSQGKWAKGFSTSQCSNTPASSCPATAPASRMACDAQSAGARCAYDSGALCTCEVEACGGTGCTPLPNPQWSCGQAPPTCPKLAPNAGTACTGAPASCEYEYCGLTAACQDGVWRWMFGCA